MVRRGGKAIGPLPAVTPEAHLRPDRTDPHYDALLCRVGEAALAARRTNRPDFRQLWDAELRVFSQWGEDGILDFLCDAIDLVKPCALELGAGDFGECNTRFLAEHRQASVVAVDIHDRLVSSARSLDLYWRNAIFPVREWITPGNAPQLLEKARSLMGRVDLVSLDIDGNDYWVAESLDLDGVSLVVAEYNALFGPFRAVSVPRDDLFDRKRAHPSGLYYGASLPAWVDLLGSRGFVFVGTNRACSNAFFCLAAESERLPLPLPNPAVLAPYMDCRVRECCDPGGRFNHLAGADRLEAVAHLPLVDVVTGDRLTVGEAGSPPLPPPPPAGRRSKPPAKRGSMSPGGRGPAPPGGRPRHRVQENFR